MISLLQDTIRYSIIGPAVAKQYFYIASETGDIYLNQSPSKNPSVSQYVVSTSTCTMYFKSINLSFKMIFTVSEIIFTLSLYFFMQSIQCQKCHSSFIVHLYGNLFLA